MASSTRRPLIRSSTRRAFCGETRMYRAAARNSIFAFLYALGAAGTGAPGPPGAGAGRAAASAAALTECPLNVRVKLNSPSLCPTMFSVTYTGMNFFPLCTAMVCPTISGTTVERRDQVLMTFFSPPRFMTSTFSRRGTSTKGPFLSDLLISHPSSLQFAVGSSRLPVYGWPSAVCGPATADGEPLTANRQLFRSPLHDEPIRALAIAGLVSLGRHTPRRHRVASTGGLAFTAAERVIDRVHRHSAN